MYEVRWLNLEYFFYKIYDFFGKIFGHGSGNNGFGIGSPTHRTFWQWLSDMFTGTLSMVWVVAIIAFLVLFCLLIYTRLEMYHHDQARKKKHDDHFITPPPKTVPVVNQRWEYIEKMFASTNPNDWRVAILEADTMLDELTIAMHIPGDNLGERLKNVNTNQFPTLNSAWEAHKVRNRIAHDGMNYPLSEREAQITKRHFEFVFRDARII